MARDLTRHAPLVPRAVVDHPAKGREKTVSTATTADSLGSRSADAVDVNSSVRSIFEELPHGISTPRR